MSSINILYYSNNCEGSKQLISMLQSEKLINFFHLICTDNNHQIPPQIHLTPTLIVRGIPTPYVAGDAFAWLAKIKQAKTNVTLQKMNSAQQQCLQNLGTENLNLLGFSQSEMNGLSDIFSFFSKDSSQEFQDALPQSYFPYSNIGQESIFTPPTEDGSYKITKNGKCSINATKQKELQKNLNIERKKQDDLFKKNIETFKNQYAN